MTLTMCLPHFSFSLCELTFEFNFIPAAVCFKNKFLSIEQEKQEELLIYHISGRM